MGIVDLIFPKMCSGCGQEGKYICDDCQKKMIRPEQICPMCCRPSIDGWTHPRCRTADGMERLIVGLPYKGVVQQCLKKVKYKSAWEIIGFLYNLGKYSEYEGIVTSVPMWKGKEQIRGFNQAKILAELVGQNIDLIERTRETKPMFGLSRKVRGQNILNAFRIINNQIPKKVILVDDVWTTGATMRECSKILKLAGAKEVWGLALAR